MASPILADGKVIFGGGTLEQLFAGTKQYPGSTGRGFVVALEPKTGKIVWKYDVGPKPEKLDPPVIVKDSWGEHTFDHGPATSSVWCTPSYDPETNTLFFGTDVNTAPRQPTPDNPKLYTEESCAIVGVDAATGKRKWNTQINPGDVWTNAMRAYDPKTGLYKDQSIGDTPKIFTIDVDGKPTKVVGVGCKNGGFYVLRADNGKIVEHTPIYTGPPTHPPAKHDPRMLALPSPIGGLQTGCATDGRTIFTNGIDAVRLGTQDSPVRVRTSADGRTGDGDLSRSRHRTLAARAPEDPRDGRHAGEADVQRRRRRRRLGHRGGQRRRLLHGRRQRQADRPRRRHRRGAQGNRPRAGVGGAVPVARPGVRRRRQHAVHPSEFECFFPKKYTGSVQCFGLPGEDEVDKLGKGDKSAVP